MWYTNYHHYFSLYASSFGLKPWARKLSRSGIAHIQPLPALVRSVDLGTEYTKSDRKFHMSNGTTTLSLLYNAENKTLHDLSFFGINFELQQVFLNKHLHCQFTFDCQSLCDFSIVSWTLEFGRWVSPRRGSRIVLCCPDARHYVNNMQCRRRVFTVRCNCVLPGIKTSQCFSTLLCIFISVFLLEAVLSSLFWIRIHFATKVIQRLIK